MKKDNKKIIIIISSVIVVLIIALIILFSVFPKNKIVDIETKEKKEYQSIDDFKTIEEVAEFLDCKYINEEDLNEKDFIKNIYLDIKYEPYTENSSNEIFYNNLISYSANVLKYNSFRIIDKEKNIKIEVICNNETKKIKDIQINGESNYFEKRNSYLELNNIGEEKETNFNIQSEILSNIIKNNWESNISNLGKKEATFRKYDSYQNNEIEIREVGDKIFNIIFTKNYNQNIVNNIKTTSSKDEIIKVLGNPTFSSEVYDCIGYKGKDFYLFYNSRGEISIYRVEKQFESSKLSELINKFNEDNDITNFVKGVKNEYLDYDEYTEYSDNVDLKYTLNGLEIKFNNSENDGVIYYNNYNGNLYNDLDFEKIKENENLPDGLYIKNENLIEQYEYQRISNIEKAIEMASLFEYNHPGLKTSNKFYIIQTTMSDGMTKIEFLSKDGTQASSQLRQNIDTGMWLDDYNFVYGIENSGIYLYNAKLRRYVTIVTGKGEFEIKGYENNILKYDDKTIKIK